MRTYLGIYRPGDKNVLVYNIIFLTKINLYVSIFLYFAKMKDKHYKFLSAGSRLGKFYLTVLSLAKSVVV